MNNQILKEEIEDWDKNAQFYANENLMPFQEVVRQEIYDFYEIKPSDLVLEAGGGVIKVDQNTTLIDISPVMVKKAKEINEPDRKIMVASTHALPFPDKSFDKIIGNGLWHHLKAQGILKESAHEFLRTLKDDGRLCLFDRGDNLVPKIFFYLRKPFKLVYRPKSQCCTRNELPFLDSDIQDILDCGFVIEKRKYLITLPFQLTIIFTNVLQYLLGAKTARLIQKKLKGFGRWLEKHFAFKPLCAEQCLVLKKK